LWDFYKWRTSGPKIRMTAYPNMVIAIPGIGVDKTPHVSVDVTNVGTAKTTLKNLGVASYSSKWHQWRRKPSKTLVVANTGPFCKPLPHVLEVGEVWKAFLLQDEVMKGIDRNDRVEFQLWHSASRKPVCTPLLFPKDEGG
jgi:hypothetical protein